MPSHPVNLISYLRTIVAPWRDDPRDDAELLARYAKTRDETAFATLVSRHGPLVWRTCRQILGNTPDAEDALQTVFLVMSRKAGKFTVTSLVGWLHRVARQTALNVQKSARQRQRLGQELRATSQPKAEKNSDQTELNAALDEELVKLPEKLRVPLLLHYLEGKSQTEVAKILGCARRTLQERLEKGEAVLRKRLEQRGLTLGAVSVAALLGNTAGAPVVPARLIKSTTQAAAAFRSGTLAGGAADGAQKLLRALSMQGAVRKLWWAVVACVGVFGFGGVGVLTWRMIAEHSDLGNPKTPVASAISEPSVKPREGHIDRYGDPLPEGAVARLGTTRFRHDGGMRSLFFTPDGKAIVGVSHDGWWMWQFPSGKLLRTPRDNQEMIGTSAAAVSGDGKLMAVGTAEKFGQACNIIELWDPIANKRIRQMEVRHETKLANGELLCEDIRTLAFLPGDKVLVSGGQGSASQSVRLWDTTTGKELLEIESHWQPYSKLKEKEQKVYFKNRPLPGTAFAPSKRLASVGSLNGVIRLWDLDSGKPLRDLEASEIVSGLEHPNQEVEMVFSKDGQTMAAAATVWQTDALITIWDVSNGKKKLRLKGGNVQSVQLSPDGKTLAICTTTRGEKNQIARQKEHVQLWDTQTGKSLHTLTNLPRSMDCMAFSPDNKTLVTTGPEFSTLQLWDVATGKSLSSVEGQECQVKAVVFSPNGKRLASCGQDALLLWDIGASKPCRRLEEATDMVALAYSSDGKTLAGARKFEQGFLTENNATSWLNDCSVWLWDAFTGKRLHVLKSTEGGGFVRSLAFAHDNRTLAAGRNESSIDLWEVTTGKHLHNLYCEDWYQGRGFSSMTFTDDGRSLISIQREMNMAVLWDISCRQTTSRLSYL